MLCSQANLSQLMEIFGLMDKWIPNLLTRRKVMTASVFLIMELVSSRPLEILIGWVCTDQPQHKSTDSWSEWQWWRPQYGVLVENPGSCCSFRCSLNHKTHPSIFFSSWRQHLPDDINRWACPTDAPPDLDLGLFEAGWRPSALHHVLWCGLIPPTLSCWGYQCHQGVPKYQVAVCLICKRVWADGLGQVISK